MGKNKKKPLEVIRLTQKHGQDMLDKHKEAYKHIQAFGSDSIRLNHFYICNTALGLMWFEDFLPKFEKFWYPEINPYFNPLVSQMREYSYRASLDFTRVILPDPDSTGGYLIGCGPNLDKTQRMAGTRIPLLRKFQFFIYSATNQQKTIIDLQGNSKGDTYTLTDIEYTNTLPSWGDRLLIEYKHQIERPKDDTDFW